MLGREPTTIPFSTERLCCDCKMNGKPFKPAGIGSAIYQYLAYEQSAAPSEFTRSALKC